MPMVYDNSAPGRRVEQGTAPGFMEKQVAPSDAGKVKTCRICGETKPASEFVARKGRYTNVCLDQACREKADAMTRLNLKDAQGGRKPKAAAVAPDPKAEAKDPPMVQIVRAALRVGLTVEVIIK